MSTADIRDPFADFLFASLADRRRSLGGVINEKLWKEHVTEAHAAWHRLRDAKRRKPFVPPTPDEVTKFSASIGWPLDGVAWCCGYETKDWHTSGSAKMKNWKAAVRNWKARGWTTGPAAAGGNASLGALQIELRQVEEALSAILYPGGSAHKKQLTEGTPEYTRAVELERQRLSIKSKIRQITSE